MYEKLLQQLAQLLRGNMMREDLHLVAFQLIAWVRVSMLGHLPGELSFNPIAPPRDAKHLISILTKIGDSKPLGADSSAFTYLSPALQHLSPAQVLQVLELLTSWNFNEPWNAQSLTATMSSGVGKWFAGLPDEVTRLITVLARLEPSMMAYIPFEESFQLTAAALQMGVTTFSETRKAWPFPWLMNLLSDTTANICIGDALERPGFVEDGRLKQFDVSLSFPPFGVKCDRTLVARDLFDRFPEQTNSMAVLALRHTLARTKKRAVIAVPNGLLFSPGAERILRDDLLAKSYIEAVISLPAALLPNTALPFSILVLNLSQKNEQIVFVDGTQEVFFKKDGKGRALLSGWEHIAAAVLSGDDGPYSRRVSVNDVIKNDAQLQVTRYCKRSTDDVVEALMKKYPYRKLSELVSIIRPPTISGDEGTVPVMEIGPTDFPQFGYAYRPGRKICITESALSKGQRQLLHPLDIAISIKGNVGKVAILPPEIESSGCAGWVTGQSCLVLRVNDNSIIDPRILFSFLKSEIGQVQLRQITSGASVPLIQLRELEKISIPVPGQLEQQKAIKTFEKIVEIERLVTNARDEQSQLSNAIWTI